MAQRGQRLQKSEKDKVLFGVCGGLGAYFSIDPVLVRVIFVVLTLASGGLGLLAYLLLAIMMPKEHSAQAPAAGVMRENITAMPRETMQAARQAGEALQTAFGSPPPAGSAPEQPAPSYPEATYQAAPIEAEPMRHPARGTMTTAIAIALIAIGALFLAKALGLIRGPNWDVIWPVILIALGVAILARRVRF